MKQRMEVDKEISKRFAQIRKATGLRRCAFAATLGIHPVVAGDIELGKREPSRQVLVKLATVYGIDLNWLLIGDAKTKQNSLTE